jgi:hypothetical protein
MPGCTVSSLRTRRPYPAHESLVRIGHPGTVTSFRERLRVPWSWWLLAALGLVALVLAYDVSLGWPLSGIAGALGAAGAVAWLLGQGSTVVSVDAASFTAGRARLPVRAVGTVEALDARATAFARSTGADRRAYFVLKGYVAGSVRVWVDDPGDPVPYWLVSTRHPDELAAALSGARESARP